MAYISAEMDLQFAIRNGRKDDSRYHCNKKVVGPEIFPQQVLVLLNPRMEAQATALSYFQASRHSRAESEQDARRYILYTGKECSEEEVDDEITKKTEATAG